MEKKYNRDGNQNKGIFKGLHLFDIQTFFKMYSFPMRGVVKSGNGKI